MSTGDDEPISQDKKDENLIMATTHDISYVDQILDHCELMKRRGGFDDRRAVGSVFAGNLFSKHEFNVF